MPALRAREQQRLGLRQLAQDREIALEQRARLSEIARPAIRFGDDGNDFDDGSSRTKRLRVVSSFEYELR